MTGSKRAQRLVIGLAMLLAAPADAQQAVSFESCAALRKHIDTRQPNEHVLLAPAVYECREPINPSVDGLTVDFGGSLVRVADQAVRPGIVLGDLHAPPQRRSSTACTGAEPQTVVEAEPSGNES